MAREPKTGSKFVEALAIEHPELYDHLTGEEGQDALEKISKIASELEQDIGAEHFGKVAEALGNLSNALLPDAARARPSGKKAKAAKKRSKKTGKKDAENTAKKKAEEPAAQSGPDRKGPFSKRPKWLKIPDRPVFPAREGHDVWKEYDPRNATHKKLHQPLLNELQKVQGSDGFSTDSAKISYMRLPFFDSVFLAHVEVKIGKRGRAWDALYSLEPSGKTERSKWKAQSYDFMSPEVHRLNASRLFSIVGMEQSYLRYFVSIVRGDLGAFRLVDKELAQDLSKYLLRRKNRQDNRENTELFIASLEGTEEPKFSRFSGKGAPVLEAFVLYGSGLFRAWFALSPSGMVEMLDDEPLVVDESGLLSENG